MTSFLLTRFFEMFYLKLQNKSCKYALPSCPPPFFLKKKMFINNFRTNIIFLKDPLKFHLYTYITINSKGRESIMMGLIKAFQNYITIQLFGKIFASVLCDTFSPNRLVNCLKKLPENNLYALISGVSFAFCHIACLILRMLEDTIARNSCLFGNIDLESFYFWTHFLDNSFGFLWWN